MSDDLSMIDSLINSTKLDVFQNVQRVFRVESEPACSDNVNFVGQVMRARCHVLTTTGENQVVNIIVKKAPADDQPFTQMYYDFKIFAAEVETYEKILYNMGQMLNECGDLNSVLWPGYYGHTSKDIFLQDLSELGFTPCPKGKGLNLNEALLVLSSLGKFHGLSLSLVQRGLYDPSNMPPNIFAQNVPSLRKVETGACNELANAIEADWGPQWQSYPDKLRRYSLNLGEGSNKLWYETRGKLDVINHGDCWINNLLFKYDDNAHPTELKFVDYQASHYNNSSWDLTCLLFSAILPSLREQNIDLLLNNYLDNLKKYSTKTGYTGYLPCLEEIKEELDRLAICGLIRSIISYSFFLNPDVIDNIGKDEDTQKDEEEDFGFKPWFFRSKYVRDNLEQTLVYFNEKNVF